MFKFVALFVAVVVALVAGAPAPEPKPHLVASIGSPLVYSAYSPYVTSYGIGASYYSPTAYAYGYDYAAYPYAAATIL